ncbi:MAG: hypothetical protein ACK58T_16430, partial [Phycisphaerae bacterium]
TQGGLCLRSLRSRTFNLKDLFFVKKKREFCVIHHSAITDDAVSAVAGSIDGDNVAADDAWGP